MISKKLAVPLSMIILFCYSITSVAGGLHFGIISAVEGKIEELEAKKYEIKRNFTDSTGHTTIHSDLLDEDIDILTQSADTGQPISGITVNFYTNNEVVIITAVDPEDHYFPTPYLTLLSQPASEIQPAQMSQTSPGIWDIVLKLPSAIGDVVYDFGKKFYFLTSEEMARLPGTVYLGAASFPDIEIILGEAGALLIWCSPVPPYGQIIGVIALSTVAAIETADLLGADTHKPFDWYWIPYLGIVFPLPREEAYTGYITLEAWRDEPPSQVVLAGEKRFYATPSVYRWTLSEFKLSQDSGASWTENLLTNPAVDFASVGIGQKVGEFISDKALACGQYNRWTYTVSGLTAKGVVAVNPTEWGGTWEDGTTATRYYYTAYSNPGVEEGHSASETLSIEIGRGHPQQQELKAYIEGRIKGETEWFHWGVLGTDRPKLELELRGTKSQGEIVRYEWDFGDGNTAEGEYTSHTYYHGIWDITLTVYDKEGNSASETLRIEVRGGGIDSGKYKDNLDEAQAAAEEVVVLVTNPIRQGSCDINISSNETIISKYWLGCWVIYIAHYGDDNKFTYGSLCFQDSSRLEF